MARFRAFGSDDEDSDTLSVSSGSSKQSAGQEKRPTDAQRVASPSPSTSSSSATAESDDHDADDSEDSVMDERELHLSATEIEDDDEEENVIPWPQQLNLEPQRVHVMQTSLFRMPELANAMKKQEPKFGLKHPRSTDILNESRQVPQRTSFAQPRVQPPSRKYIRVAAAASASTSHEGICEDAGLAFGRSFRVSWGPGGKLVHLGNICRPHETNTDSANSSIIKITQIRSSDSSPSPDLLSHFLQNTHIESAFDREIGPHATPNQTLTFSSFASLFGASDHSHTADVFRLGHALFDPIDLHLAPHIRPDIKNRVAALRRTDEFSSWLAQAVVPRVEEDLRTLPSDDLTKQAFVHLTGNQVEKAVDDLLNAGNIRLATLISQTPGDEELRADAEAQLRIWRDEKADALMSEDIRKMYALAAGLTNYWQGSSRKEDIEPGKGLDWLRVVGLQLWFASLLDAPLKHTLGVYERICKEDPQRSAPPTPWYSKVPATGLSSVKDGLYLLMKLFISTSMTLESTLLPLAFSTSPRDNRIPWLIYVLLARCMRIREFLDPMLLDEDDSEDSEQNIYSATAESLTISYASQLEQEGSVQEAAFVLLFLKDDIGRKRALQDLLARSAPLLDEWNVAGLHGSLKIPIEWIKEAQAGHAFYQGNVYEAYELYIEGGAHKAAHELAITYLAPEVVIRGDFVLLKQLFDNLDSAQIPIWSIGGELFSDYATILTRVPELEEQIHSISLMGHQRQANGTVASEEIAELDRLTARISRIMEALPEVLRDRPGSEDKRCSAALSIMLSNLLDCADSQRSLNVALPAGTVNEGARLRHIQTSAYELFMNNLEFGNSIA